MKNIKLFLILMFILAISGCVTGSKAVKSLPGEICKTIPAIEEESLPGIQAIISSEEVEKNIPETKAIVIDVKPIKPPKIPYSQIVNTLSEFIDIKENSATSVGNNYFGISENKLVALEIRGNKDEIKEASMKLIYPKGIAKVSVELNNAMMFRFLKNAAPEYSDWHAKIDEILNKFNSMTTGIQGTAEEGIKLSDKMIQILYNKSADCIEVTLKTRP